MMLNFFRCARTWAIVTWALVFLPMLARAQQDIQVSGGTNPFITLGRNIQWGGSGVGNLNNNFIFSPVDPNQGFCLFLANKNPSNAHSVTVSVSQTGDPSQTAFQGVTGRWFNVPTTTSFPTSVPAATTVGINYKTTASANIAVTFSGATTQAGSPDTVDVFAVQTNQSACGSLSTNAVQGPYQQGTNVTLSQTFPVLIGGLQSPGSTGFAEAMHIGNIGNGLLFDGTVCCQLFAAGYVSNAASTFMNLQGSNGASTQREIMLATAPMGWMGNKGLISGFTESNFLAAATNQNILTPSGVIAFSSFGRIVNPGASATILHHFMQNTGNVNPAYKSLTLSCSALCELFVNRTTAVGTTCTALTAQSMQIGNGGTRATAATGDLSENACATQPTVAATLYDLQLGPGASFTLDLTGWVNFHSATTGSGLSVVNQTAVTGNVAATLTWAEQ